jgi:hypothetical protein
MTMKLIATRTTIFSEDELFVALASGRRFLKERPKRKAAGKMPAPHIHSDSSHFDRGVVE